MVVAAIHAVGARAVEILTRAAREHLRAVIVRGAEPWCQLLQINIAAGIRVRALSLIPVHVQRGEDVLVDAADGLFPVHLTHRVAGVVVRASGEIRRRSIRYGSILYQAKTRRGRMARRREGGGKGALGSYAVLQFEDGVLGRGTLNELFTHLKLVRLERIYIGTYV